MDTITESPSSKRLLKDPYRLLKSYMDDANVQSKAYSLSEGYYRRMYNYLTYPLVITSTVTTLLSGIQANEYVILALSGVTMLLVGFNQVIQPKNKEHSASQVKSEFGEIHSNINQFVLSNNRTDDEIKIYSEQVHELLNVWNGLKPPVKDKFINKAKKHVIKKTRRRKLDNHAVDIHVEKT